LGNPVRLIGGPGQENDITHAHELVEGLRADATIADKGYDANHLRQKIIGSGGQIVIPPKRNLIERFFNKLKQFRRTRGSTIGRTISTFLSENGSG
jgi:putative transposase